MSRPLFSAFKKIPPKCPCKNIQNHQRAFVGVQGKEITSQNVHKIGDVSFNGFIVYRSSGFWFYFSEVFAEDFYLRGCSFGPEIFPGITWAH